ncbi:MAG: serine hydrolase [Blastocatellia bacterium]
MTSERAITQLLGERIAAGDFPSAAFIAGRPDGEILRGALGNACVIPEPIKASVNTIYDVASLTKPLVTALLTSIAIERHLISAQQTVGEFLGAAVSAVANVTIRQLATHSSGLPAWLPLYLLAETPEQAIAEILKLRPWHIKTVVYSDLNFILLGKILEEAFAMPIDVAAERLIFLPLGLKNAMFRPRAELRPRIAASEIGNRYEAETCRQEFPELAIRNGVFRDYLIWGEVHDANAYFLGGAAGHAGLFADADSVFRIALQFLPETSQILQPATCSLFTTNFTPAMAEARSFGFQLALSEGSTAGPDLSPSSFGHNGFTGTCLWIEPESRRIFVLLTNRTHNRPLPFANINEVRRRFNSLAAAVA